jgi:hypothetical protein
MQAYVILIGVYSIFLAIVAWYRFKYALAVLVLALPTYLLRFSIGPFPSTVLEVTWGTIFLVWCFKYLKNDRTFIKEVFQQHKLFFIFVLIFFLASILGVLVSDMVLLSLGQWRAYFLEPLLLFFILLGRRKEIVFEDVVWFLVLSTLSISVYSIFQKITGWGIATAEWTNPETRRVTAFFSSPNAVGLYLGPIVMLLFTLMINSLSVKNNFFKRLIIRPKSFLFFSSARAERIKQWFHNLFKRYQADDHSALVSFFKNQKIPVLILIGVFSLLAILFTKSEGTMLALGAGVLVALFLLGFRKVAVGSVVVGLVICLSVPRLHSAVLFQDKPGQNRLTLWSYSWSYLTASPKNFILGAGVRQFFRKIQKPHYDAKKWSALFIRTI